jgi:hypothetical protein
MTRRHQSGAALLAVSIMLTIMAALAFALNRQTGMTTLSVEAQYDLASARYLAEAGANMARWANQYQGCKTSSTTVPGVLSGVGTYSIVVTKSPPKNINVVSTGATAGSATIPGATAVLTRTALPLYQLQDAPESKTLGGPTSDTYINTPFTAGVFNNTGKILYLAQGQSQALLQFALTDIPPNSLIDSATLSMVQTAGSSVQRAVNLYRVTAQWDAPAANWTNARPASLWTAPGGDYATDYVAQASAGLGLTVSWDITTLVDAWLSGKATNYGILLKMANTGQAANFYSFEASGTLAPVISVKFYKAC